MVGFHVSYTEEGSVLITVPNVTLPSCEVSSSVHAVFNAVDPSTTVLRRVITSVRHTAAHHRTAWRHGHLTRVSAAHAHLDVSHIDYSFGSLRRTIKNRKVNSISIPCRTHPCDHGLVKLPASSAQLPVATIHARLKLFINLIFTSQFDWLWIMFSVLLSLSNWMRYSVCECLHDDEHCIIMGLTGDQRTSL